jgi:polysaccharide pyruvyl transferase WcaK-like protein
MRIAVLGWYGHGNAGDEAYKLAFPAVLPGHDLHFSEKLTGRPDMVVLGGGDIVHPAFIRRLQAAPDIPKVAASVSLTTNSDFNALAGFARVHVRDHLSLSLAQSYLDADKLTYTPDFTFVLDPNPDEGRAWLEQRFEDEGHSLRKQIVVVVLSNYIAFGNLDALARDLTTFLKVSQDVAVVADNTDASFVFLPFSTKSPNDDRVPCAWAADRCKHYKKNIVVYDTLSVQQTLNIIGAADAVVSSRLHSTIFATLCGTPFIDLTHHDKNRGFVQTVGKTAWSVPYWEFSVKHYRDLLCNFLQFGIPNTDLVAFTARSKAQLKELALCDCVTTETV